MADIIQVNYQQLEQIQRNFLDQNGVVRRQLQALYDISTTLKNTWEGDASNAFQASMNGEVFPAIDNLSRALVKASEVMKEITRIFRQAEEEGASFFGNVHLDSFGPIGPVPFPGFPGGGAGGGSGGAWSGRGPGFIQPIERVDGGDFPEMVFWGYRREFYDAYRNGEWGQGNITEYTRRSPFDYFEGRATIWNREVSGQAALYDSTISGNWGTMTHQMFGVEGYAEGGIDITDNGIGGYGKIGGEAYAERFAVGNEYASAEARFLGVNGEMKGQFRAGPEGMYGKVEGEAGIYLADFRANAEVLGFEANVEAYVGANVTGSGEITFNPLSGDAHVQTEGEVFAGARTTGEVTRQFGPFKITLSGEANAGAGAGGRFEAGVKDGVASYDIYGFTSLGLGAGGGMKVEADVGQIADDVTDFTLDLGSKVLGGLFR